MYDWYPMNVGNAFPLGNETIHGTCSCCGGPVCTPTVYWSVVPPVPKCKRCGAVKRENYGPVIDMVPQTTKVVNWPSTSTHWYMKYDSALCPDVQVGLHVETNPGDRQSAPP